MALKKQPPQKIPDFSWKMCIAKTTEDGEPGLTVAEHCRNVAEVSRALIERLPAAVIERLGASPITVSATHDVGKVSPGFQKKYFNKYLENVCPKVANLSAVAFEDKHAIISELALTARLGVEPNTSPSAAVVGAHHGIRTADSPLVDGSPRTGGPAWAAERQALLEELEAEYGELVDAPAPDLDALSGLVCVADWMGSDEGFFPPAGLPAGVDRAEVAREAVAACGWTTVEIRPGLSFAEVYDFEPYPMQSDFVDAVTGPGLYVLEAPMGLGKTEAALYAAYRLMEAGHNSGLYFGLPTRLTSDRIHQRVQAFLDTISVNGERVRLAHGQAWMRAFEHGGAALDAGREWFRPSKRALLLPFAVGTVDQALLAVLKVRHHFVRGFGLAGKVVILDEVHSYDLYTGTLLDLLVRRLLELGCTVIILSATLTAARRRSFVDGGGAGDAYPLVSASRGDDQVFVPTEAPADQTVDVALGPASEAEVAELAAVKAASGHCVLCIANTVAGAQRWYNAVKAAMSEGAFEIGLLHSGFPAWRRRQIEDLWMERLGKDGNRPEGCVLVATQVVEQSVDIDADLMITELAPTDMLIQRLGRLWRHHRPDRPCQSPVVRIVVGDMDGVDSLEELEEALGVPNCRVYQPYVLWRSFQVWKALGEVALPGDIRSLLEATYATPSTPEPTFIGAAHKRVEAHRKKLARLALSARASAEGYCTMPDDERAATRYSELPTIDALLVQKVDISGSASATLELSDGASVTVDAAVKNPKVTAALHKNLVRVPHYRLPTATTPKYLGRHFFDATALLLIGSSGALNLEGDDTALRYDDERGLQRDAPVPAALGGEPWTGGGTDDPGDWEGGLDEFGW